LSLSTVIGQGRDIHRAHCVMLDAKLRHSSNRSQDLSMIDSPTALPE
jgi:hypothetical protein